MRGLAALLRRNTQLLLECSRLQPVLEEQQVHCCAAPASAGSPLDLPRRRTCKSSNDGVPGWRAQHVKGASDAATLEPPASSGGHVGSGKLDASAAHERRRRSRAPALDPATHPAAFPGHSLLPGSPGTHGLGPGLMHAQASAATCQSRRFHCL